MQTARKWQLVAATLSVTMVASLVPPGAAQARPAAYQPGHAQQEPVVTGHSYVPPSSTAQAMTTFHGNAPVWPAASTVDLTLPSAGARAAGLGEAAGVAGLPVTVDPAGQVQSAVSQLRVESFDRATTARAGVDGLLLRLTRTDGAATTGPTRITVDYNAFRNAYGGDWASRLRLRVLPQCALTTPDAPGCQGTPLDTDNDVRTGVASASVPVAPQRIVDAPLRTTGSNAFASVTSGGTLVALAAGASGGAGDYKATSLGPSATWTGGGNSGDFTWSYPIRVPPSLVGPAPTIAINYSAASVDGRMASTNNQPSWLGEGFDWQPGSVERRYQTCAEDMGSGANNTVKTGDQCWATDGVSLSLDGHAGDLIKDGTNPDRWHLRNDDGTIVEHRTGAANGDNDGEWWVATTTDGTQYWFGGRSGSNSTLTVPVFGNNAGEPCHQTAFKDSSCTQGYRWQLDYVVDTDNNTMAYTYAKETNRYGRNNTTTDAVQYDRAGYLTKIEYGTRTDSTGPSPMQVLFDVSDRCLSSCGTKDAVHWPDVPWDQECTASPCKDVQNGPSFWTTKRLTGIRTQVWDAASGQPRDIESWTFSQSFPDPTDSITPALWLDRISHNGLVGAAISVPDITFVGQYLSNRVDTFGDQYPAMNKFRLKTVTSESGGKLDVTYSQPDCVKGTRMPDSNALQNNVLRCYPVKWTPAGATQPINDFFQKYVVTDVVEADLTGSSTRVVTHYDYLGDPAWHYTDDDGLVKADYKTWSVWRGYGAVATTKGDPGEQTRTETRYFRGMNGDHLPSGTRSVSLPAIATGNIPAAPDEDAYAGMDRETITYNGPSGAEVSATVSEPWESSPTATRTINGTTVYARFSEKSATHTRTALDGGRGYRTTTTTTAFDGYGMPVRVEDRGDDAVNGDEQCTLTDYARNTSTNLVSPVSRVRTFAVDCTRAQGTGLTDDDVIDDVRTSYDSLSWGATPTKGDVTKTEVLQTYNGGNPTYFTQSSQTLDQYGRVLDAYDVRGGKTSTAYTPATGGPVTATTETSPLGWVKSTTLEPAWGLPLATTDVNNRKIELAYDGLGRLTAVWLAGRDRSAPQTPNITYDYLIRANAPSVVTTKRLNASGGYITSYKLYDNLLRERQSQDADGAGGPNAVVADTYYDSAGRAFKTHDPYLSSVPPSTNLFLPTGTIPSQRVKTYDGVGREILQLHQVKAPPASPGGTTVSTTTTGYGGDRTDVTPPTGGTATSTVTDVNGNTVQVRQYHTGALAGNPNPANYDATIYTYNRKNQLSRIADAAGNQWNYEYDLRGRRTVSNDPDKGKTTTSFNDAGDVLTTTDGRNTTIAYTYDAIGRKTTQRDGSATGPLRAAWYYDTLSNGVQALGQLVKTVRYDGANQYIKEQVNYTADYQPTSVKYTIPASETGLAGTYTYVYTYNQDGSLATTRMPAMGDLGLETLTQGYDALGNPTTLSTSLGQTYVTGIEYTSFNEIGAVHLANNGGARVDIARTYETDTRRLAQIWTTKSSGPATTVADVRYSYDAQGNVRQVSDLTGGDTQCFSTDYLQRMTEAWTPASGDCNAAPSAGALGGPAPYWQSYTYDTTGTRTKLVEHSTPDGVRTTDYTPVPGKHELASTSTADNLGTRAASYTYDLSGNTLTRQTAAAGTQTLTWDAEGHLATAYDTTGDTAYVYDVDGNRLVRRDPTGKTLYLPDQELRYTTSGGAKTCTRYYTDAEETLATRTSGGVVWLASDQHGTAQISINAVGQATSIRRETPFGQLRSTVGTWPARMDKGFVGGTNDNTGLTHLGAREYDPLVGRFISVDPVIDDKDPQQMHGYAYANNAPVTASDANGLWPSFVDKAVNKVNNAVHTVTHAVTSAVTSGAKWVYNNAGTISTVLSVAALACTVIPPLQVAAPFLGAAATAMSALDTIKTCSKGMSLDCAMGAASLIPGGRVLGTAEREAKAAKKLGDAAEEVEDGVKAGRRAVKPTGCHSFDPATPVLMAGGQSKPIGDIKVGDQVLSTDPATGQSGPESVTALHRNDDHDLTEVTVRIDGDPVHGRRGTTQVIKTTWHHPIWDLTLDAWVEAAALVTGHQLLTQDGSRVTVIAVRNYIGEQWMRDLTVADVHTYYVIVGGSPVLVHNVDEIRLCELTMGPGPYAKEGVALPNGDKDAPGVQDLINESGARNGCHTCGASEPGTTSGNWITDHQHPSALGDGYQTGYPQCNPCRYQQGGVVRALRAEQYYFPPMPRVISIGRLRAE